MPDMMKAFVMEGIGSAAIRIDVPAKRSGGDLMNDVQHKECYGTMFPDALHFRDNEPQHGKVFMYELDGTVGMGATRTKRKFTANIEQWDDCLQCPEFEHCYRLCMGKLTLQAVIANE